MFRFTIRDVLWLMLVVGFGVHTWIDRRAGVAREQAYLQRAREEIHQRELAERRANLADRRADRFAKIMYQLQVDLRLAKNAAESVPVSAPLILP